ncbi:MAG: aminoglycoside phosphotransferase family protein [Actinomycetota bacterium]|nr:aminoglycoside phosphotransferase family protein [Actinomycetota bacterium]MDQ3721206.1 aminoglycoside phosphotransferase family protein [Actinomycetota bacterium]
MPVGDAVLSSALAQALGGRVQLLGRRPLADRSSFPVEELDLLCGGRQLSLVFKDCSPDRLSPEAASAKPSFLRVPGRELEVYNRVLEPAGVGAPACHGTVSEPAAGRFWLFIEHVDGELLWRVGEPAIWAQAARWLADLHGRPLPCDREPLLSYDGSWFRLWLRRALEVQPDALDRLAASHERAVALLCSWPRSLVHGEFYPSNVLIEGQGADARVRPVDWEMAGVGPGLLDLAALVSGGWSAEERERLTAAYYEAWPARLPKPGWDEFHDALDHCRLQLAVQWIGWSREWTPPAEHAHDWLSEALSLADRLSE